VVEGALKEIVDLGHELAGEIILVTRQWARNEGATVQKLCEEH
jgi:hypothetical protein